MYTVTFYSFKGGVGRTMALVNVAVELTKRGKRVLVVDFDLEAPGVHTYAPFRGTEEAPGVVDYVTQYISTLSAPDAQQFISRRSIEDQEIWCMPAGLLDPDYPWKLNSIDWRRLYEEFEGYLLFEDLKKQWEERLRFDYVLIDSRTGHTDVGGICTRQLPDATALLFFPNDQNILGLKQVASDIRDEFKGPARKHIQLHFCPSNVPDLDDEEAILENRLERAKEELNYKEPACIIHHYRSLSLLDQQIFVQERPKTRLSKEYRDLVDAIVEENIEDKAGVISKLRKIRFLLRRDIIPEHLEELNRIFQKHSNDGEVAFLLASIYRYLDDQDSELAMLNLAIEKHYEEPLARTRRASILISRQERAVAREDLHAVISSKRASGFELSQAIERLRDVDPDWIAVVKTSPALKRLKGQDLMNAAEALLFDRKAADFAADLILARRGDRNASVDPTLALALIASGRFEEAKKTITNDRGTLLTSMGIVDVFNYAAAEWGSSGEAPIDLFGRVTILGQTSREKSGPNFFQCLALSEFIVGRRKHAVRLLGLTQEMARKAPPRPIFSCWRYLNVSKKQFLDDLDDMSRQFNKGKIAPPYVKAFSPGAQVNLPM